MIRYAGPLVLLGLFCLASGSIRSQVKEDVKPGPDETFLAGDTDPLPDGAMARLGNMRLRHVGAVRWLHFSGDGRRLASLGADNMYTLWDAGSGKELRRLEIPGLPAISGLPPEYEFLVPMRRMRHFGGEMPSLSPAVSADGTRLASVDLQSVQVWDLAQGKKLRRIDFKVPTPRTAALSADGKRLAYWEMSRETGECMVHLVDVDKGQEIRQLKSVRHHQFMGQLQFSPDGTVLVGVENHEIRVWDLTTGKRVRLFQGHQNQITSLAIAPGGKRLASAGPDGLRVWELDSEEEVLKIENRENFITALAFSPAGATLATGSGQDKAIRLIHAGDGKEQRLLEGHKNPPAVLAFSPDGKTLASGSTSGTIRLWDLTTGKERKLPGRGDALQPLAVLEGGTLVAVEKESGVLHHIEPISGKRLKRLAPPANLTPMSISPDGKTMAVVSLDKGGGDGSAVRLVDIGGKKERNLEGHSGWLMNLRFSHSGRLLATTSSEQTHHLWNVDTGKEVHKIAGRIVLDERMEMMMMMMGRGMPFMNGRPPVEMFQGQMAFSCDDRILATTGLDNTIHLWETASGKERCHFKAHQATLSYLAFSPDGKLLATASSDESVRLWDTGRGKMVRGFLGHKGDVRMLAFSPNGKILASGGDDGVVRLWDVAQGKELRRFTGHRGPITNLVFAPDGKTLFSGGKDNIILMWNVFATAPAVRPSPRQVKLQSLWDDLASADGSVAHQAVANLIDDFSKDSLAFFKARLQPVAAIEQGRIKQLIADLNHSQFTVRQKASQALEKLGGQAEEAVQKALANPPSAETGKRLQAILTKLKTPVSSPDSLRILRAVEVLERLGTNEALQLLDAYAKGAQGAPLTRQAQEAISRLKKRGE